MSKKIGNSILLVVNAVLVFTIAVLAVAFLVMFVRVENTNLKSTSSSSTNVLRFNFHSKEDDLQMLSKLLSEDSKFIAAVSSGDESSLNSLWSSIEKSEAVFCVFTDPSGNVAYKSDNCPVDESVVLNGIEYDKIQLRTDGTDNMFNRYAVQAENGATAIVCYSYADPEIVDDIMSQTENHATIFCGDKRLSTTMTSDNGERAVGTSMSEKVYKLISNGENYQQDIDIFGEKYMSTYEPLKDENGNIIGALFTGSPMAESMKNRASTVTVCIVVGVIMLFVSAAIFLRYVQVHISRPIENVRMVAVEMEKGNLKNNPGITVKLEDNEIGELANALSSAVKILDLYVGDISDMMKEMSEGNFGVKSDAEYKGDFISIGHSAENLCKQMRDVITQINSSADSVYNGSEQVSNIAGVIADGTTKQAAASEELSASIEAISRNIILNSESAGKAQEFSHTSIRNISSQSEQIDDMLKAMSRIESSTNEISKIIKSIEDIAFQTNILALNAAVEAARAGEAGKGFAVVADEVRNLANKSAEAASNTSSLIENCVEAVKNGSEMAKRTAEVMSVVVENVNNTNKLIDDITQQTSEQAESVKQVQSGVQMITDVVQQNSATAEESAANCQDLNSQAITLREQISVFRI